MVRVDLTPTRPEGRQTARRPGRVSVNGREIPRGDIARETQNHPAARPVDAWMAAARALVVRELLLQEAERLAVEPDPATDDEGRRETDEESRIRLLVERAVVTPVATEAECRRIYDAAPDRFRTPDLHAVSHILVAAAPDDSAARAVARTEALRIATAAGADESLFAALAEAHSACPSGRVGGSLGQIGPGQTVPEFEAAIAALPVGRTAAEPVETRYGFHVVRVEHRIAGEPLPFAAVRAAIADRLADRARRTAIRQYIALLAGQAVVEGISLDAANSPLVQ
jgi:peptidyl-prolyl cis-trans isomerase C